MLITRGDQMSILSIKQETATKEFPYYLDDELWCNFAFPHDRVLADRELHNTIKLDQKSYTEWYHICANLQKPLYRR